MAYFMVHLNIAQEMYKRYPNIEDQGAFYLGSIAPDAIAFKPGYKHSDKQLSHFYVGDDWNVEPNCDEWRENLTFSIEQYKGRVNKDFLYGYFSHVVTDIETTRLFYGPVRDKHDNTLMEVYLRDCSAAEAVLLGKMGNLNELWSLLYQSNQHCLPEFFTCTDVSTMLDFMKNQLYSNMPVNPEYHAGIYGINNFWEFINNTIILFLDKVK